MVWLLLVLLVVVDPAFGGAAVSKALLQKPQQLSRKLHQNNCAPGCYTCVPDGSSYRCQLCLGSLILLRSENACGCPAGTYNDRPNSCRDCPKGSFCPGGKYTGEDNTPAPISCEAAFMPGLTTLGSRCPSALSCVNMPGYRFDTTGPARSPVAMPCPPDTYSPGFRKQRGCVPCPAGLSTFGANMSTSLRDCDYNACISSPCGKNTECKDLPKPALGGPSGRVCTCMPGSIYVNDTIGCVDAGQTTLVGGSYSASPLADFELRCPRGSIVVAVSGTIGATLDAFGPVMCSDGSGGNSLPYGAKSGNTFTTSLSPDGFKSFTIYAADKITSISLQRQDNKQTAWYGTPGDGGTLQTSPQKLECPNYGVAVGFIGQKLPWNGGSYVKLGLICTGLPCPIKQDSLFGPDGASAPTDYLPATTQPFSTNTATQCCSACTGDFNCMYWVRQRSTGDCWLISREPLVGGVDVPAGWSYQSAAGFDTGMTQGKLSGISTSVTYVGCFADTPCSGPTRLDGSLAVNDPAMTTKKCAGLGLAAGYTYVGLAPGSVPKTTSCYGSNRLPTVSQAPGCFAPCSGNSSERCGDATGCTISIYSVVKPRWPVNVLDAGDQKRALGWYDVQCQGVSNDFCRWVGTSPSDYWSCALAGSDSQYTLPGEVTEQFATSMPCQETGYRAQSLTDLSCSQGDLSQPWDNNCRTRQCCKAKCDSSTTCTGFVFGDSINNDCRSPGDGKSCCWLKGGDCKSVFSSTLTAWQKAAPVSCEGTPPDPPNGIFFCPSAPGPTPAYPQGTVCNVECDYGVVTGSRAPYAVCLSNGAWSDVIGLCKPKCTLPPILCPP